MTDKYLPITAVDDLMFALEESLEEIEDERIKANSCFDLLMLIADNHPEEQVKEYIKIQLKQIEGVS